MVHRKWYKAEEDILGNLYPNPEASRERILGALSPRTWASIQNKAREMGLHREIREHNLNFEALRELEKKLGKESLEPRFYWHGAVSRRVDLDFPYFSS